ncbi:hypothetical protein AKO1_002333, partial [Acrasis kona]
ALLILLVILPGPLLTHPQNRCGYGRIFEFFSSNIKSFAYTEFKGKLTFHSSLEMEGTFIIGRLEREDFVDDTFMAHMNANDTILSQFPNPTNISRALLFHGTRLMGLTKSSNGTYHFQYSSRILAQLPPTFQPTGITECGQFVVWIGFTVSETNQITGHYSSFEPGTGLYRIKEISVNQLASIPEGVICDSKANQIIINGRLVNNNASFVSLRDSCPQTYNLFDDDFVNKDFRITASVMRGVEVFYFYSNGVVNYVRSMRYDYAAITYKPLQLDLLFPVHHAIVDSYGDILAVGISNGSIPAIVRLDGSLTRTGFYRFTGLKGAESCSPIILERSGRIILFCSIGFETRVVAFNPCVECPAGTYASDVDLVCKKCPAGTYSEVPGLDLELFCISCKINTFSDLQGASNRSACIPCPKGSISTPSGDSCIQCVNRTKPDEFARC